MELTNDIKAKVLNMYSGAKGVSVEYGLVEFNCAKLPRLSPREENYHALSYHEHYGYLVEDIDGFKLLLKPICEITEKDAVTAIKEWKCAHTPFGFITEFSPIPKIIKAITECGRFPYNVYQCLQSLGYDLRNYYLDGKTLQEAGLATYK